MSSTTHAFLRGQRSPATIALILGRLFSGQNRDDQAEAVYGKALQDFGLACSDWDTSATLLRDYIRTVSRRGTLCDAKAIYEPVFYNFIFRLGRSHKLTLVLIHDLGNALWESGALSEAEQVYLEAIFDVDISRHHDNVHLLHVMERLGVVYMQQGRWREAEDIYHAVLKGFLKRFQNYYHHKVVGVVLNLGAVLYGQEKLGDAASMFQWGSSGLQQAFGLGHANTIQAFDSLAFIHKAAKNFIDAEFALRSALDGCESLYGKQHERTLHERAKLVMLFRDQSKFSEAQAACKLLLDESEGLESEWKCFVLNYSGTVHSAAGDFSKAEEDFATALTGFRNQGGQRSPWALLVLYNMGSVYLATGRSDLAEVTYRQSLAGLRQLMGQNHIASRAAAEMLALSLLSQGKIADAANTCSETLNLCNLDGRQSTTETHRLTAANFALMTTSCLPSYRQSPHLCSHDGVEGSFVFQSDSKCAAMR